MAENNLLPLITSAYKKIIIMSQSIQTFYGTLVQVTASKKAVQVRNITEDPHGNKMIFDKDTYWAISMLRIAVINKEDKYFKFEVPSWIWDNKVEEEGIKEFEGMSLDQFSQFGLLFADDNYNELKENPVNRLDEGLE